MNRIAAAVAAALALFPAPAPAQEKAADLAERQAAFLSALREGGKTEEAYTALLKGSALLKDQKEAVEELIRETDKGIEIYGKPGDVENLGVIRQDKRFAFGLGILCTKRMPLFYYFVWYRESDASEWRIINVWFNDQSKEFIAARR